MSRYSAARSQRTFHSASDTPASADGWVATFICSSSRLAKLSPGAKPGSSKRRASLRRSFRNRLTSRRNERLLAGIGRTKNAGGTFDERHPALRRNGEQLVQTLQDQRLAHVP